MSQAGSNRIEILVREALGDPEATVRANGAYQVCNREEKISARHHRYLVTWTSNPEKENKPFTLTSQEIAKIIDLPHDEAVLFFRQKLLR